jgi:hypothetical protein
VTFLYTIIVNCSNITPSTIEHAEHGEMVDVNPLRLSMHSDCGPPVFLVDSVHL